MHVELVDKEVIGEVLSGNVDAYNKLIDKYKSYVFTITYKILNNKQDAEEAAVFLSSFLYLILVEVHFQPAFRGFPDNEIALVEFFMLLDRFS